MRQADNTIADIIEGAESPLKPEGNSKSNRPEPAHGGHLKHVPVVEVIDNPTNEQIIDRKLFASGEPILCCPVCQFEATHVQAVYTLIGGDESEGLYRGSHLVARETPYRRDALAVRVHGECGHLWDIVFQQHKGNTFVRVDVLINTGKPGEELHLERV